MANDWSRLTLVLAAFAIAIAVAGTPAEAVQGKCLVAKNKCVSKKIGSLLKCEQKAETPGKPTDPNADGCVDKAKTKFDGGAASPEKGCFEKLESKKGNDCVTFDDTTSAEDVVEQCVASLVAGIDPPPTDQTKCGVGKQKCVAKKLSGVLKCHQKVETPGKPTDPNTDGCVDKVQAKFDGGATPEKGCIAKLESKSNNDCLPPTGNTTALEQLVDGCVADVVAALETPSPTTTTTAPVTTTTATTAPTTTTIGPTTTTPTTSTTTTTSPTGVTCGANGLDVTVALQYPPVVGFVSGVHMAVRYPAPLAIPGSGNVLSVRQRVTSLLSSAFTIRPNDRDTNADTVDDQLDADVTSNLSSVPSADIFRVRYDCPSGTPVSPSSLSCMTSNPIDQSGLPFPAELAAQITCNLRLTVP